MIHNSDGMSKKCNSKSLFFFIFSPGFAPYFRMSEDFNEMMALLRKHARAIYRDFFFFNWKKNENFTRKKKI